MVLLMLLTWGPILLALGIALSLRWTLLRHTPRMTRPDAVAAAIAGGIPSLVVSAPRVGALGAGPPLWTDLGFLAALPLILGIFGVVVLSFPARAARTSASARLAPRTLQTFVRPRQPIVLGSLAAIALALTLAAGAASETDELGHHTRFTITLGTSGTSASTGIYGWYHSLPSLTLLAVLLVITAVAWLRLPRPAWGEDIAHDTAVRRTRADNITRLASGAVLLHLAVVFNSLRGTASVMLSVSGNELGMISLGTPFAAMQPALFITGTASTVAGVTLWMLAALSGVTIRTRRQVPVHTS
ncbi:hypothetical protein AB0E56_12725 [Microbacterium sp. NPDC028030]|uniref:hypothetical protein n=1 Tax=Microbacterium sp. NPDC028030 TaxID=3155124 RepID=UPI0033E7A147